ncbi:MAG TPA: hypothetical protein VGM67_01490 [Gemmatimonadaceae bacterium]
MTVLSTAAIAQTPPALRALGPVVHVSTLPLKSAAAAIPLRDGRVYVNDITARRILLFDSTLTTATVVADTTDATANAYGQRAGTLIRYRGDSALFMDATSLSMLVLGPAGTIGRVMAIPRPEDAQFMIGGLFGAPNFDGKGRLAYYSGPPPVFSLTMWGGKPPVNLTGPMATFFAPKIDSGYVVRVDLASRVLDTAAAVAIPKVRRFFPTGADGNITSIQTKRDPLPVVDDWAGLPDGTIAIVRGRDFHVDWLSLDGRWTSSAKIPFDWQHVDDEHKLALIDSATTADQKNIDGANAQRANAARNGGGGAGGRGNGRGDGGGGGGGGGASSGSAGSSPPPAPNVVIRPELGDLPDYMPAFARGAVWADADDNLWIRTSASVNGQPVYDVVNRQGALVDRVQLPPFRTIAGFGRGVVYMAVKGADGVVHLERARIR